MVVSSYLTTFVALTAFIQIPSLVLSFAPNLSLQQKQHHTKTASSSTIPTRLWSTGSSTPNNNNNENTSSSAKEPTIDRAPTNPNTQEELMYALGVNMARQLGDIRPLVENGDELTLVAKGLLDTVVGRLSDEGQRALLSSRGEDLNKLIATRANAMRERLVIAGKEMLENMSQTDGVQTLPSGVRLHILTHGPEGEGRGVRPTAASAVRVHYHGTLPDATTFDSTLGGDPVTFAVGQVIPGWKEALLLMHEGETALIGIPPEMAYGERGTPDGGIPGGATIFFKVQLLEVLSAGIGGSPTLLGVDGKKLGGGGDNSGSGGLLGADGKPMG